MMQLAPLSPMIASPWSKPRTLLFQTPDKTPTTTDAAAAAQSASSSFCSRQSTLAVPSLSTPDQRSSARVRRCLFTPSKDGFATPTPLSKTKASPMSNGRRLSGGSSSLRSRSRGSITKRSSQKTCAPGEPREQNLPLFGHAAHDASASCPVPSIASAFAPSASAEHAPASCPEASFAAQAPLSSSFSSTPSFGIPRVSADTVASLIRGGCKAHGVANFFIVDCRYSYEHEGGHIANALHLTNKTLLKNFFDAHRHMPGRTVVVFHCEFSQTRAPKLSEHFRKLDRSENTYPALSYPEVYVMDGGYREFFSKFPALCTPSSYVSMFDPTHTQACKKKTLEFRKEWSRAKGKVVFSNE